MRGTGYEKPPIGECRPKMARRRGTPVFGWALFDCGARAMLPPWGGQIRPDRRRNDPINPTKADELKTVLTVNGTDYELEADPRTTLLDALRNHLGLTGTKKGCDHGQCGACTVLLNGRRINSCLTLACMHGGDAIKTIEGIGSPDNLSPLQRAFVAEDGLQCGYCTPGQICSASGMLDELRAGWPSHVTDDLSEAPEVSDPELAERMSGNLCRCSCYPNIIAAIRQAAQP
jgi:xanthine dehydrogenase YagT iron-sulfur-binding subunit